MAGDSIVSPSTCKQRPKSPPLAFQMTSNDALNPPTNHNQMSFHSSEHEYSSSRQQKPNWDLPTSMERALQAQIKKQADTLRMQHEAFAAERDCWEVERDRLYRRISSLESLLRSANGHRCGPTRHQSIVMLITFLVLREVQREAL